MDELLGVENNDLGDDKVIAQQEQNNKKEALVTLISTIEKVIEAKTPKVALAKCDRCDKPLFDAREMHKISSTKRI